MYNTVDPKNFRTINLLPTIAIILEKIRIVYKNLARIQIQK